MWNNSCIISVRMEGVHCFTQEWEGGKKRSLKHFNCYEKKKKCVSPVSLEPEEATGETHCEEP